MKLTLSTNTQILLLSVMTLCLPLSLFICAALLPTPAQAQTLTVSTAKTNYYLNLSSSSEPLTLAPSPDGTLATATDHISVSTNTSMGWALYLSSDSSSTNALLKDGSDTAHTIPSTTIEYSSAAALPTNSWGFSTDGTHFSQVPTLGNEQKFYPTSEDSGTATNVDVTFGVRASTLTAAGSYSGTVVYTALVNASLKSDSDFASFSPSTVAKAGGSTIYISTSLMTPMDPGTVSVKIGDSYSCATNPVVSTSTDGRSAISVSCVTPALPAGTYPITLSIPKFGKTYVLQGLVSS